MVSIDNLSKAIVSYIGNDLVPSYPIGTHQRIAVGVFAMLLKNRPERMKRMITSNTFALSLVSDDGQNVDIDELADVLEKNMTGDKLRVTFPVIGQVGFDVTDVAKIKEYAINPEMNV